MISFLLRQPSAIIGGHIIRHLGTIPQKAYLIVAHISRYIVADAYFSVSNFVDGLEENGFHLVNRFRSDADLMYLYTGERTGKKGRPRRYDGKINFKELDIDKVEKVDIFNDITLYASPYLVATDKGYTKHYYAGSERVCAKLGSGGLDEYGDFWGMTTN